MKANVDKLARRCWLHALACFGLILSLARWFGPRSLQPIVRADLKAPVSCRSSESQTLKCDESYFAIEARFRSAEVRLRLVRRASLFSLLLYGFLTVVVPDVSASIFQYQGTVTGTYEQSGRPPAKVQFKAVVSDCNYVIEFDDRSFGPKLEVVRIAFNGDESVSVQSFAQPSSEPQGRILRKPDGSFEIENRHTANIRPSSPVPSWVAFDYAGAVWLTVASGCSLVEGAGSIESPAVFKIRAGSHKAPDDFRMQPFVAGLATNSLGIVFCTNAAFYGKFTDVTDRSSQDAVIEKGALLSEFRIVGMAAQLGASFPQRTEFKVYEVPQLGSPESYSYQVEIESVSQLDHSNFSAHWPEITGVTLFTDERFNSGNGFHFNYVTNRWLTKTEVQNTQSYKVQKAVIDISSRQSSNKVWRTVMLTTLAVLGIAIAWRLKKVFAQSTNTK